MESPNISDEPFMKIQIVRNTISEGMTTPRSFIVLPSIGVINSKRIQDGKINIGR